MKLKFLSILSFAAVLFTACGGQTTETVEATEATEAAAPAAEAMAYTVDTAASTMAWKGSKIVGDMHTGFVKIAKGELQVANGAVAGGSFVVDMNTITDTDVENPEYNAKLVGHLMSDDFFSVSTYPTATFEITKVEGNMVTGNLTLKGVTKEISFPAEISAAEGMVKAHAEFAINRVDWGVQYGSGTVFTDMVKDKVIADEIAFVIDLVAKA